MKAILFVILNVSVCFPRGSVGVEILIPRGFGGVERKKFFRLAIARHDPLQHTFNFYPGVRERRPMFTIASLKLHMSQNVAQRLQKLSDVGA